jgi:cysteine-rich repeat protein
MGRLLRCEPRRRRLGRRRTKVGWAGPLIALAIAATVTSATAMRAQSFSADPVLVSASIGNGNTFGRIATDGSGTLVAVWDDAGAVFSRSADGGQTWSAPATLDTGVSPVVVSGGSSFVVVSSLGGDLYAARSADGATWTTPALIATSGGEVEVGSDGNGTIIAVERFDDGIEAVRSTDEGVSWSSPQTVLSLPGSQCIPTDVAADGSGGWLVVCYTNGADVLGSGADDADIVAVHSGDGGATWSTPVLVNVGATNDTDFDTVPLVVATGASAWMIVWDKLPDTLLLDESGLFSSRSADNGATWFGETAVGSTDGDGRRELGGNPRRGLASDGSGNWAYAWDAVSQNVQASRIRVARSRDAGASWVGPALLTGLGAGTVGATLQVEDLTADSSGNWFLLARSISGRRVFRGESAAAACGDGFLDAGEECDDGNLLDGDCCTSTCERPSCRTAQKAILVVKNKDNDKSDKLLFKWLQGESTSFEELGDGGFPSNVRDYTFCLYPDGGGQSLAETEIWAGAGFAGWLPFGLDKGFKYKDDPRANEGTKKILLKASDAGKTKAVFLAKGEFIPDEPQIPITPPVTAALVNRATGVCMGATFSAAVKNEKGLFKAVVK